MKKTVLITGGSRGIGRATALLFAQAGYNVVINHITHGSADLLLEKLKENGYEHMAIQADISKENEVDKMVSAIINKYKNIDVLVNNAGIAQQKLFTDITTQDWDNMFDINVKGLFNCCKSIAPYMISKKQGKIINISSMWGIAGASCEVHYSASKAAVIGFTKALAKELGMSGICVNCVAPGVIDTDMNEKLGTETLKELRDETPLGRIGTPIDVANTILFLASEKADFITGQVISTNGGFII